MLKKVRHHNLIGHEINESLEFYPNDHEDREIYCYRLHQIVEPQRKDCETCPYFTGVEQGHGIECTWDDEIGEDEHVVYHKDRFKEYERIDKMIQRLSGKNDYPVPGVTVNFAMSEEQAKQMRVPECIMPDLPRSQDIYFNMEKVPDELCEKKIIGWERIIKAHKKNVNEILKYLLPQGVEIDSDKYLNQIDGDYFWLIGFGD